MKLKKGMYVRTDKGIARYLGLRKDVYYPYKKAPWEYEERINDHIFTECIFDEHRHLGDYLTPNEFNGIERWLVGKPSYNLIDLIEKDDYVNGYKVEETYICPSGEKILHTRNHKSPCVCNKDIKHVVTKKQFLSMGFYR